MERVDDLKKYWKEVGLVSVSDNNGAVINGKIIDIMDNTLIIKDTIGRRHWISIDAVVRIMEVHSKDVTS